MHRAKKSRLKTVQIKLSLLNSVLYVIYELKLKTTNKKSLYYHLVSLFNSSNILNLPLYQIGEEIYWKNDKDVWYAYSKLISDKLLLDNLSGSNKVNITQIIEDI